jgi:hypothetical protein
MKMKSPLFTLVGMIALVFGLSTFAEAKPKSNKKSAPRAAYETTHRGHLHSGRHGRYTRPYYGPPRLIHTREISRRYIYERGFNRYGRPTTFRVRVVTYLETYSNGATRTYTRVFR